MDAGPPAGSAGAAGEVRDPQPPPPPPPQQAPPERRRLYREPDEKKLAGVCAGLADYTGVDPALVRAGTVLLALMAPITVVAYLVAIFAIDERPPDVPRVVAPPVAAMERHRWLPLALIAGAVLVTVGGGFWWLWPDVDMPLAALVLVGIGAWLLARNRSDGSDGPSAGAAGGSSPFAPSTGSAQRVTSDPSQKSWSADQEATNLALGVDITTRNEESERTADRTPDLRDAADHADHAEAGGLAPRTGSPPADEGAGPPGEFPPLTPPEWSGPEAASRPAVAPVAPASTVSAVAERGSERLGLAVTAVVLMGGGTAWLLHATDVVDVDPEGAIAVGLLVVGVGLVVAAWRGRARAALVPLGIAGVVALASAEVVDVPLDAGAGSQTVVVSRPSQLTEPIDLLLGELEVDLRDVPLSTRRPTEVEAGVGIGELRVIVPRDAHVVVHADVRVGAVTGELESQADADGDVGALMDETYVLEGRPGAPRIELELNVGVGEAAVVRE